ncbi:hypothetical protein [Micromonospora sp. RTGN7]|uniref:hypothetical protein n=1 Tax=Micromonospora sp. RTGN7 TaxID=3016526 RepID=UPI0029FEDD29|nr:hypothetical protein [Micromonospora sp. RTGN7]
MIRVDGREWGTAVQLAERLGPDVTEAMVRRWRDRKGLTTVEGYSPLDEAAAIEATVRRSPRGRPRRLDLAAV